MAFSSTVFDTEAFDSDAFEFGEVAVDPAFARSAFSVAAFSVDAFSFDTDEPEPEVVRTGGGTSRRDKKRKKVIRLSDLAREEYEAELQALASEITIRPFVEPESDDDEILLMVLARIFH